MPDFNHPLVGRAVVYRGTHPNAKGEDGVVTSVNVEAGIVFVRYRDSNTSQATAADDRLTFLNGDHVGQWLDEYPDFDAPVEECGNCGGEGYVYDCIDGMCVHAEEGCELCAIRCDYCNPARPVTPKETAK